MRILVIGGGGREHAMAWALTSGRADVTLVCAPGNPGIAPIAKCVPADLTRPDELVAIADREERKRLLATSDRKRTNREAKRDRASA